MTGKKKKGSLDVAIATPISLHMKSQLLSKLWSKGVSEEAIRTGAVDANAYLEYYIQQCGVYMGEQKCWSCPDNDGKFFMATHQDIIDMAEKVVSGHKNRQEIIIKEMMSHPVSGPLKNCQCDEVLGATIDWAARLVTMLEIGRLQRAHQSPQHPTWDQQSLKDYIASVFLPGRLDIGHVRLEESFNVQSLQRLANLEIEWTNDLMSHLSLRNDDKKVLIFHHVSFLEAMNGKDLFPPDFCAETLHTIALLLPSANGGVVDWYRKQPQDYHLDSRAIKLPLLRIEGRQIDKFHFWRERLTILKQVLDEAEPKTISQWWYDRRRGPQWYTFWVAIVVLVMTVFFGLVQSIEGALQVYLAWHS